MMAHQPQHIVDRTTGDGGGTPHHDLVPLIIRSKTPPPRKTTGKQGRRRRSTAALMPWKPLSIAVVVNSMSIMAVMVMTYSNQADDKDRHKLPPAERKYSEAGDGRPSHHRPPPSALSSVLAPLPQRRTYDRNASASALLSSNTTAGGAIPIALDAPAPSSSSPRNCYSWGSSISSW